MAFVADFTQSPENIILQTLVATGNMSLTTDDVTFGAPEVSTDSTTLYNTLVTLTANDGSGYKDTRQIKYLRVDISTVPGVRSTQFIKNGETLISDLVARINSRYLLNLVAGKDYADGPLPAFPTGASGETVSVTLTPTAQSLCWIGSLTLQLVAP